MSDGGIFDRRIERASIGKAIQMLHPHAECIRLYDHTPSREVTWWEASVPLSRFGPNRAIRVQSLGFDAEMSRTQFLEAADEIARDHGGLSLVQSYRPLPADLHPRRFPKRDTLLKVLMRSGACLYFEMPYSDETASVAVFGRAYLDNLMEGGLLELDDPGE